MKNSMKRLVLALVLLLCPIFCFGQVAGQLAFKAQFAGGHTAKTTDWANRVVANGGAMPSAATLGYVDTFQNALVTAGIDSLMIYNLFFAPDSEIAAKTPFYHTSGSDPATLTPTGITINGMQSGGASEAWLTGINPAAVFTTGDMGLSVYTKTLGGKPTISWGGGDGSAMALIWNSGTSYFVASYSTWTISGVASGIASGDFGFYSANRTSTSSTVLYNANGSVAWASIGTSAGASGTPPTGTGNNGIAWNSGGVVTISSTVTNSYLSVHHGFTTAQGQAEFNAVQALRTSFGGGFK